MVHVLISDAIVIDLTMLFILMQILSVRGGWLPILGFLGFLDFDRLLSVFFICEFIHCLIYFPRKFFRQKMSNSEVKFNIACVDLSKNIRFGK